MKLDYKKLLLIIGLVVLVSAFTIGASSAAKIETIKPQNENRINYAYVYDAKSSYITFHEKKIDGHDCPTPDKKSEYSMIINVKKPKSVGIVSVIVPRRKIGSEKKLKNLVVKGYNKDSVVVNLPNLRKNSVDWGPEIGIIYNFKGKKVKVVQSSDNWKAVSGEFSQYWYGKGSKIAVIDHWVYKGESSSSLPTKFTFQAKKSLKISSIKVFYRNSKDQAKSKVYKIGAKKVVTIKIPLVSPRFIDRFEVKYV